MDLSEKFNEKVYSEWVEKYISGLSTVKIAKEHNCSQGKVYSQLKLMGVPFRSNSINSKIYVIENKDFFESIDTERKAYYLGFILADGYITSKRKGEGAQSLGISLAKIDRDILVKFKNEIKSSHPIGEYISKSGYGEGKSYVRLLFRNQKIVDDLKKSGIVENKTNVCEFPSSDILPYHLIKHFIRGYMDGDGSIKRVTRKRNGYEFRFSLAGTQDVLNGVIDYLYENKLVNTKVKLSKRHHHQTVMNLEYGGNLQTERILDHIYSGATVYLDRKYCRYKELKEQNLKSCA